MLRAIGGLFAVVILAAFIYFSVAVPLGTKTLWQHVRAIAGSDETQELVRGVKGKAKQVTDTPDGPRSAERDAALDQLTPEERRELRRLIRERMLQRAPKPPTASVP